MFVFKKKKIKSLLKLIKKLEMRLIMSFVCISVYKKKDYKIVF